MPVTREEPITLVCAADAAYVRPLAAMMESVLANRRDGRPLDVYVLAGGISPDDRARLASAWARHGARARWLEPGTSRFAGVPIWGRMSVTTYYKLAIGDLLPAGVRRAIWLDCDLLVLGDIATLWDADLNGHHALAVQDRVVPTVSSSFGIGPWRELGLAKDAPYFNAGVMLIDVDRWRRDGVAERAMAYLRTHHQSVYFWDQEGLNVVLAGRWGRLDEAWNCNLAVPGAFEEVAGRPGHGAAGGAGPWILHFAGSIKPWAFPSRNRHRRLFYSYLDRTPWGAWRPEPSLSGRLIDAYEASGLRRIAYPLEQFAMRAVRSVSRRTVAYQPGPRPGRREGPPASRERSRPSPRVGTTSP